MNEEDKPVFLQERQEIILRELSECGKARVRSLSEKFGVTEDCIRKDLKLLENRGKLKRTYGGAILSQDYPLQRDVIDRKMVHTAEKEKIAEKAVAMIRENETVFLDISTTNIKLAQLIAAQSRRLIVVSNMIDILQILANNQQITTIGTGGTMYRTTNGFMGIATAKAIQDYSFDRAFIGSCGIDMVDSSITTLGAEDGLTKMAAINASRHKYIVMESEKFYYNECYKFAHFDDVDGFISDKLPNEEMRKELEAAGVELY